MKKWSSVLCSLLVICLISSMAANIVTISKLKSLEKSLQTSDEDSMQILSYGSVGLRPLFHFEITKMYVDQRSDPDLRGDFYDMDIFNRLHDIVKNGCYQKAPELIKDSAPGSGVYPTFSFETLQETDKRTFELSICSDNRIRITIDEEVQWYYTNINAEIRDLIYETLERYYPK